MSDLQSLYQSVILDHNRSPRNKRAMVGASHRAAGRNPLCGDEVTVWLRVEDGRLADVSFDGKGCAISQASASLMTQAVKGKSTDEAREIFERFQSLVTGRADVADVEPQLGRAVALSGIARFPMRVKCASLGWHAMNVALRDGAVESVPAADALPGASTE
jgi:nitrogen fixation NifU-like protein